MIAVIITIIDLLRNCKKSNMQHKNQHQYYMREVLRLAQEALYKEVPVAAIIVDDGEIIGRGLNARERNRAVTAHAEIIAIEEANKIKDSWNLGGSTIYVNLEPCAMCAGAILQSHISTVVFAVYDPKSGALGSRYDLRTKNLEVIGGVLEAESLTLLQEFFNRFR